MEINCVELARSIKQASLKTGTPKEIYLDCVKLILDERKKETPIEEVKRIAREFLRKETVAMHQHNNRCQKTETSATEV